MTTPPPRPASDPWHDAEDTNERIEHDAYQTEHSLGHRPLPSESPSSIVIDEGETPDPQCERGQVAVDGKRADDEHPAWCSAEHCYVTEGVRVHEQAPTRWEDGTAELRCETRLVDPVDDGYVYVELDLQNLRFTSFHYCGCLPVEVARRLRDQLTEHLDAVQ